MKIAIAGNEANIANRVGSNQYAFELLWSLSRIDKENNYTIFLSRRPLSDMPPEGARWNYKIIGPKKLWNFFGLPFALMVENPRPSVFFNPGHYAPIISPYPMVISIMDLAYLRFPDQFTKPILAKLKFWTHFSILRSAHVMAISRSTRDDIIERYKIPNEKITVSYPGYDYERFNSKISVGEIEAVKKKYNLNKEYVLFLSTLKPSKNIEGLVNAFYSIKEKAPNVDLVIAGRKGWMFNNIYRLIGKLNLRNRVRFTDFVPGNDIPGLMAGAKVFALPSFWEGFGIPVIEAMACGVPVVVSDRGSLPEIVGNAGIIVDPMNIDQIGSGLLRAIKSRKLLGKACMAQAKKFSWEVCAKKTLTVLESVGGKK